ncbi:MAG: metal ABC transporter permease, partial [Actinobacteria bacterium]|nr:metal ABC transporter permease [Actinomycetota bacterium]
MDPVTLFEPEFARRALLATLCIAVAGGLLGTTVVLRDLPFFAHAVGSGAYPALVAGAIWGWQPHLAGFAGAIAFAGLLWLTTRGRGAEPRVRDTRTGLVVAAALAGGAVLARAFAGDAPLTVNPEAMLFGSVLTVSSEALTTAFAIAAVAIVAVFARGDQWLATGFDRGAARGLGVAGHDFSMLLVVALAVAAALPLTGALMAGALLVIPAATARMLTRRTTAMTIASVLVAVGTGVSGLYVSLAFDLPAGASIAATASAVFVLTALGATVA